MIRLDMLGALALRASDGREFRPVLAQPKRLAILAYLAVESANGPQRRDRLFALFWPELSQAQARQALRQSIYFLRRSLGADVLVNRGADEIGLDAGAIQCDVRAFIDHLESGRLDEGLALYRGSFLDGFFIADASPEFEQWLDATRAHLERCAIDAAWSLADATERAGNGVDAVRWARFAVRLAPTEERSLQRMVALYDRQGDRASAVRAYAEFAHRLDAELEIEPSAETQALVDAVRSRSAACARAAAPAASASTPDEAVTAPAPAPNGNEAPSPAARRPARRWFGIRRSSVTAGAGAAVALIATLLLQAHTAHRPPPVVAVGWIQDPSGADTGSTVRTFAELFATDLARVPGLAVVSHARLYDVLSQLGARAATPSAISDAARHAGAEDLIEAVLSQRPDSAHPLRLDIRRVDLASGASTPVRSFSGRSISELADRATAAVAAEFDLSAPSQPLGDVTTTSLAARSLYEEGLRRYYQDDLLSAAQLFHAALGQDSSFAMAAYYAGLSEADSGLAARRDLERALRLADRASDRERLIIRSTWAFETNDPAQLAIAESLATRYPTEPGAELAVGRAAAWEGKFSDAIPHLWRAVRLDSLSLSGQGPSCRACEALAVVIGSYTAIDSMAAAERIARLWTRMQPRASGAWWALSDVFAREEKYDSALAAERNAERYAGNGFNYVVPRVVLALRAGQFDAADRMVSDRTQYGNRAVRDDALWWSIISLRNQGRLEEALRGARELVRVTQEEPPGFSTPQSISLLAVAQVLFESGRYREAALLFDSVANYPWRSSPDFPREAPGLVARHRIWMTTQEATALAAAGDTARLTEIADSCDVWGPRSAFFRDRTLVHYVRGLLWAARGQLGKAEAEYRTALVSPIEGYSRINLELGKTLVAEHRARDAIPILEETLHGPVEASSYYLTFAQLHAAIGLAFDRAGQADSAIAHYRWALAAWHNADPVLRPQADAIARRLRALGQGATE